MKEFESSTIFDERMNKETSLKKRVKDACVKCDYTRPIIADIIYGELDVNEL
jgi:hypothetical protein